MVLEGDGANRRGLGASLTLTAAGGRQYLYHSPYRGFMSTMDDREHFGLGRATRVDSLVVTWPDGRAQVLTDLGVDRMVTVKQVSGVRCQVSGKCNPGHLTPDTRHQPFQAAPAPRYKQMLPTSADFAVQPLLPYEPSRQGPPVAVADVNGDGLDDLNACLSDARALHAKCRCR